MSFRFRNNSLMSVTDEISQDSIGPCGPLEQSVDNFRHSTMAAWSSALDCGAHPAVEYYRGNTVEVRVRVTIIMRVSVRDRGRFRGLGQGRG